MRFRKYQQEARRISGRLLWLYVLAVVFVAGITAYITAFLSSLYIVPPSEGTGIAHHPTVFGTVFALMIAVIAGAGWIRLRQLSEGGHVVAQALGGVRITRTSAGLSERRLLNVVEEMAIASGVRMPKVYILPEWNLNAFAAGMSERDAVIGITRGAVQAFNRDELQAVVAHEFSHILNGDMRRNMQLCGCLYGLQMITSLGRFFVHGDTEGWLRSVDRRSLPTFFLGLVLRCIGFIGSLAAGWIQAAISRQREFLADASAVQFTRQSDGLASALYKVAVAPNRRFSSPFAAEYAHFMFEGVHEADIFDKLAATHPDIYLRIERLSPFKARRWKNEIREAQSVSTDFFYVTSSFASFSDGQTDFSAAEAEYDQARLNRQTADAIRAYDLEAAGRVAELLRIAPRHWLSAEGDGERLFVVLTALFLPQAVERIAQIWETAFPLRAAFYRRLRQHPLPQPLHRALLEYLLPSAAALTEPERQSLKNDLYSLVQNETLQPSAALLWLEAAAWLEWFKQPKHENDYNIHTAATQAVQAWVAEGGRLNHLVARELPQTLHRIAGLERRERSQIGEHCRRILAENGAADWSEQAWTVVKIYCR
ncbi:heat shock protein HtpX [Neisseria zoodegmatis]|uniref:Heat shock protein HtpX n=1 Tax=Neisseria zoodegmatis TaxID=326523 RepID=A0A378WGJ5_9NEIS|nr:M48 family metalloprotease [Neisseria zoodegmatis]SUA36596.1 heat shock protein HtpX [Neisseria zoodegmatis]